jgi:hypothetical protein
MALSDIGSAVIFALLALIETPWAVVALAGAAGVAVGVFRPLATAAVPMLVSDDELEAATGAIASADNSMTFLGAVLGGLLVGGVGADWALSLNAVSFVVSAVLIASCAGLSGAVSAVPAAAGRHLGLVVERIRASPVLRQIAVGWTLTTLVLGAVIAVQVPLLRGTYDARPAAVGALLGLTSLGLVAGSLFAGSRRFGRTAYPLSLAGIGAAAMITGQTWLRVPETIKVSLTGHRSRGVCAKDVALTLLAEMGPDGASYQALEFHGPALPGFTLEDRLVISNLAVEMDAKASIFPADDQTRAYLADRAQLPIAPVTADAGARYARELVLDVSSVSPRVALPHSPENVVPVEQAAGTPVHMVFIGTCTGGRVPDFHDALAVLEAGGGRLAPGLQLVVTPASREVQLRLLDDGTLRKLAAMGAIVTTPGCGACCGTSGAIPADGMNVLSTANRNFKARMGNQTASIFLASPATCAASALTGRITDPR